MSHGLRLAPDAMGAELSTQGGGELLTDHAAADRGAGDLDAVVLEGLGARGVRGATPARQRSLGGGPCRRGLSVGA